MSDNTQRIALPELTADPQAAFARINQTFTQLDALIDIYAIDIYVNSPPPAPNPGDIYIIGDSPSGAWSDHADAIAYCVASSWTFYDTFNGLHAFVASNNTLYVYTSSRWAAVGSTDFATQSGIQTLSNKTFAGDLAIYTSGGRVSLTSDGAPLPVVQALFNIVNKNSNTCGLRTTSYWTGSTASPYQNNDNSLWEVYNNVASTSANRSWAGSFANAYNNIPTGVTDSGERTGIIGWAVSAASPGYIHGGTLQQQIGCHGVAGFQGPGSDPAAVITNATGVRGYIYNDSTGSTITNARAGEFVSTASTGTVQNNIAVYAAASNGTQSNYSFYGYSGKLFNSSQILASSLTSQSLSAISARIAGNTLEFGHPDTNGYASNVGATWSSGTPFVAFCAEADTSGNTFTTRGKLGTVISNDLSGALVFSRLTNASASGQNLTESGRFDPDGHLTLATTPYLPSRTPASSTAAGKQGEFCWDSGYLYICVATNSWKRVALSSW